jgi:hypothetical protein
MSNIQFYAFVIVLNLFNLQLNTNLDELGLFFRIETEIISLIPVFIMT